jgi:tetratricopeptide (TPR) repeat protein
MKLGDDRERLTVAARFNALAEEVRNEPPPRAVLTQRADLLAKLKEEKKADEVLKSANGVQMTTADDFCLSANELAAAGKYAAAIPLFRKAVRLDAAHFWSHFGLAFAYQETGRLTEARSSYGAAIALRPDFVWSYFNRAMAALQQREFEDAVGDLDKVVELKPDHLPAVLHRGQALSGMGNHEAALRDLDEVLAEKDPGGLHVRAYLMRAKVKKDSGDLDGAKADTEAGLRTTPTDDAGWLVRAHARIESDPAAALADLEQAVKLSPNSIPARQNQAYVLDKLGRDEDCLVVLTRLTELAPANVEYRSGRAVLLARLKKYDEAVRAITKELEGNPSAGLRYQAACVYALSSRNTPAHKAEALKVLTTVIRDGFPATELATDKDLDPLRGEPDFQRLLPTKK